ncbi:LuxR C-terminal-related transcriptional regulator [Streptomyces albidoflavus]
MTEMRVRQSDVQSPQLPLRLGLFVQNELLRMGLQAMLSNLATVGGVKVCKSPEEALAVLFERDVHVLLLSGTIPFLESIDLTSHRDPRTRVLMLLEAPHLEPNETSLAAIPADGYLLRDNLTADSLDRTLTQITMGEMPIPILLGRQLLRQVKQSVPATPARTVRLTPREQEVLAHLTSGLGNKEIARHVRISEHGVKRLVSNVLLKLGASNRTAAVVTALRLGLVD